MQQLSLADLTQELVALVKPGKAATADDLGTVQAWSKAGDTADQMRAAVTLKKKSSNGVVINSLAYMDGAVEDARKKRQRTQKATTAPSTAPPAVAPPCLLPTAR